MTTTTQVIQSGQYKGFYAIVGAPKANATTNTYAAMETQLRDAAGGRGVAWYKYSPGPGKTLHDATGATKFVDGYFYVPLDPTIDLQRQLYALENGLIPPSGNTETFNLAINRIHVPNDWCPVYLDPQPPWYKQKCAQNRTVLVVPSHSLSMFDRIRRWVAIAMFCIFLAIFVSIFIIYG